MNVLITGGLGFVGRHFALKFLETDDNQVTIVDNMYSGLRLDLWYMQPRYVDNLTLVQDDLRHWIKNKRNIPSNFDLIIHCAAVVGGRLNIDGDPLVVATDLSIDAEFFNWVVRGAFLPKVIYFSSSAAYATELQTKNCNCDLAEGLLSFDTSRIGMPDMTYGFAKLAGEYLARFAYQKYGLDVQIYRPFGGYGEDQSFDYPFPSIIRRVLRGENPITVWGSGKQERDFIHIDDIVDAVLHTMKVLKPGEVLNLGTGVGVSFKQLATIAHKILRPDELDFKVVNDPLKPEGVFRRVADVHKLETLYQPKVWLEQGIARVGAHLQKVLDREPQAV
jgi:nucleoside-diphosphate-sugar epimerase